MMSIYFPMQYGDDYIDSMLISTSRSWDIYCFFGGFNNHNISVSFIFLFLRRDGFFFLQLGRKNIEEKLASL